MVKKYIGFLIRNHGDKKEATHFHVLKEKPVNPKFYTQQNYLSGIKMR